jgi:hypothetical protein
MNLTSIDSAHTGTTRLRAVMAALVAVVAAAGIAGGQAAAGKPVPTITIASCQLATGGSGSLGAQITIAWAGAGKVADPMFVEVYVSVSHVDGTSDDINVQRRILSKGDLKANETTFVYPGLVLAATDSVTVNSAQWLDDTGNTHNPPIASSTNQVACT